MDVRELLSDLSDPRAFPDGARAVTVVQTHISMVFLTERHAYKVKKPVVLWGFLDYGTVEKRRFYCEEEVRLNRRAAPETYLGVERVVRRQGRLHVGGDGELVDHAVVMARFPDGATLKERLARGEAGLSGPDEGPTGGDDVRAVAAWLARVHREADHGESVRHEGRPVVFARILRQNFRATKEAVPAIFSARVHDALRARIGALLRAAHPVLRRRLREGRLVEGHGDLRAEHAVLLETATGPAWRMIDCLEFTPSLRCIDPLSDAAFLAMDLTVLGHKDLADAFLAAYLTETGDPDADALLPLFLAYRAHVRAKVDAHRASEAEIPAADRALAAVGARRHLALAWGFARRGLPPPLLVLVGASGAGKSVVARELATLLGADVFASDRIRKELAGLRPTDRVTGDDLARLYAKDMSGRTYATLLDRARASLAAGRPAVLDATFLDRASRTRALDVARGLGCPAVLVEVTVPVEVAERRIGDRARAGADPSDATVEVYREQLRTAEPNSPAEHAVTVRHDGTREAADLLLPLLERLVGAAPR